MKKVLFDFILGRKKPNWFSRSLNRYSGNIQTVKNETHKNILRDQSYHFYDCPGAGLLAIGDLPQASCGGKEGFSISAEWGEYGYIGGVLPKEEAKKLADHIYSML